MPLLIWRRCPQQGTRSDRISSSSPGRHDRAGLYEPQVGWLHFGDGQCCAEAVRRIEPECATGIFDRNLQTYLLYTDHPVWTRLTPFMGIPWFQCLEDAVKIWQKPSREKTTATKRLTPMATTFLVLA